MSSKSKVQSAKRAPKPEFGQTQEPNGSKGRGLRSSELEPMTIRRGLSEADLQLIVDQSGIRTQARIPNKPIPLRVVDYGRTKYRIRAYPNSELAQKWMDLVKETNGLVASCYGRVDRYLVLEYVEGNQAANSLQVLDAIASFLAELESVNTTQSPEDDFRGLCEYMEAAGIFLPQTTAWMRRYYERSNDLSIKWTLQYYDAMPRNFVCDEQGRLLAIDEKHLRLGPRGVSLVKAMGQLPENDFQMLKEAYFAKAGHAPLDEPRYKEFLSFYRLSSALGTSAAHRTRHFNTQEHRFHEYRRTMLKIISAPATLRLREEIPWRVRYRLFVSQDFVRRAWGFMWRRLVSRTTDSRRPELGEAQESADL